MLTAFITTLFLAGIADFSSEYEGFPNPLFFMREEEIGARMKRRNPIMHCSEVTEEPFANCFKLRSRGKCSSTYERLKEWCPRTCKFCISERAAASPTVCKLTAFGCCADGITPAKGPKKEGCPEMCRDTRDYPCKWYAKNGFCKTHIETMKKLCPRACKFCGRKIVDGCFNLWEDDVCAEFAKAGICLVARWKKRVATNCARSCGICTENFPQLSEVKPSCSKEGCCWDNKTPISKGCPPCKDYFGTTLCQRFSSECNKTERMQGVQMRIFCPETCGLCKTQICKDDITYGVFCKEWEKKGECARDPLAMRVFCKKTCNFCSV